jgi:hypothetical protein
LKKPAGTGNPQQYVCQIWLLREIHQSFIELTLQRWGLLFLKSLSAFTTKDVLKCKTLRNDASKFDVKPAAGNI